jgi:hypothetical protein
VGDRGPSLPVYGSIAGMDDRFSWNPHWIWVQVQRPAYILWLIRSGKAKNWDELRRQLGVTVDNKYCGAYLGSLLGSTVDRLLRGGFIEATSEGFGVTPATESLRDLGVSLTELATFDTASTLRIIPLFGLAKGTVRRNHDLFVLMPFRPELRPVYEDHIRTVATRVQLSVARADDFFTARAVIDDIWAAILSSRVIIADCTGRNPNVFYEIGIAHTVGKPVVLITQDADDVPFDLRHRRYLEYRFTPRGMAEFEDSLARTLLEVTAETDDSSPSGSE